MVMFMLWLQAAAIAPALPERSAWLDCLTDYAQAEMAGPKSTATITVEALHECRKQQAVYWALLRRTSSSVQKGDAAMTEEERAAGRRLIQFINRNR